MGDIIQTLPAVMDAKTARPDIHFDWVIEEEFKEIIRWSPLIQTIIPCALRRWRRYPLRIKTYREIYHFLKQLRDQSYDCIIDPQGLLKSSLLTRIARGAARYGYAKGCTRGQNVQWAYTKKFRIGWEKHALTRIRLLFSQALHYPFTNSKPYYGIDRNQFIHSQLSLPKRYLIFIHNASWISKLWPEAYWLQLMQWVTRSGKSVLLPWGTLKEQARAQRLAVDTNKVQILPKVSLSELAYIVSNAEAIVSVDTGLLHLAAALDIPTVSIYGPTDNIPVGRNQNYLLANFSCAPCRQRVCRYTETADQKPACFTTITPQQVWNALKQLLIKNNN